jgi:hypothetical protein
VITPIVALLEKRGFLYNHSGDFPQVILIVPSHVPNTDNDVFSMEVVNRKSKTCGKENVDYMSEPVFLNVYRAQESIPRNEFRQPM